jgi:hypothetical protein
LRTGKARQQQRAHQQNSFIGFNHDVSPKKQ